jgi:predicted MFS family arabinose efflux permease
VRPLLRPPAMAPFRVRSFRFQWPADLFTSCAFEMETLILGWYVLVETGSVFLLTVFGALLFAGTLVAPMFGVIGDRIGHRNLLCGMRACYAVLAAIVMVLAFAGRLSPVAVLVLTGLMGMVRSSDLGVRIALVASTMPADRLTAAMGISRTTSDSARIAGALTGAGVFAVFGIGPAYVAVVCLYVLGLLLTAGIADVRRKAWQPDAAPLGYTRPSAWRDLREGIAHVWDTPRLLAASLLVFLVNLTAFPLSNGLLPYVVREVYLLDQTALGYLVAAFAFGALLGSVAVSLREGARPARTMLVAAVAWHAVLLVFAQMRGLHGGILMLIFAGFAQSFCIVSLTVLLLRSSSEVLRGRVIGVRMLAIYSLPLGLLAAGVLIERIGFSATATLYAGLGLACTLLIALRWRAELWHSHASAPVDS